MIYRKLAIAFFVACFATACGLDLNAPDEGTGGSDPDSAAVYQNVSSSHLPGTLGEISRKAEAVDIDNDGDLDLVIAVELKENKILINDGTGAFMDDGSRLPSQSYDSQDIAAADFNGDGYPDLFFVGNQEETNSFYINDGTGKFSDLTNQIPVSGNSTTVEALDIDGDGPTDMMIGSLGQNVILINRGNASFTNQTQRLPVTSDPTRDIEFADLNGDNLRDIIVGNDNGNLILINDGSGFFEEQTSERIPLISAIEETRDVNIADVNGDGARDIYFGNSGQQDGSNPQDRLLINDGRGIFSDQTSDRLPAISTDTFDAEFADVDRDGNPDLIIGNNDGGLRVLINDGSGAFTDETGKWIPKNFSPMVSDIEIADFNDDQLLDVYISVRNAQDQLLLQENN